MQNIQELVVNRSFDEIKMICENSGIRVKDNDDLFLLVSNENESPIQQECNGVIIEKNTNKIVCLSDTKFIDLQSDNFREIVGSDYKMEYCEDGTLIRLYNYKDHWYTATTKCIDAKQSFWSSQSSFDDMFWQVPREHLNLDVLDKNCTYFFILCHSSNRIVVEHNDNRLIYIKNINNTTFKQETIINIGGFNRPVIILGEPTNLEQLSNLTKRGVIVRNALGNYKYDFKRYNTIKDIRGNLPLIRMRYLELLQEPEKLLLLESHYPEHAMVFAMAKHGLNMLYQDIHKLYIQSHVKHTISIYDSHPYFHTLRQLHGVYKKTQTVITLEEVKKKVDTLNIYVIRKLLNWV